MSVESLAAFRPVEVSLDSWRDHWDRHEQIVVDARRVTLLPSALRALAQETCPGAWISPSGGLRTWTGRLVVELFCRAESGMLDEVATYSGGDVEYVFPFSPAMAVIRFRPSGDPFRLAAAIRSRFHRWAGSVYPEFSEAPRSDAISCNPCVCPDEFANLMDLECAWNITRGAGVRVGLIDRQFDACHEALSDSVAWWAGGYGPSRAHDAESPEFRLLACEPRMVGDDAYHGTAVASLLTGRSLGGRSNLGVVPESTLVPLARGLRTDGYRLPGTQTLIARAICALVCPGAEGVFEGRPPGVDVISMSFDFLPKDGPLEVALDRALRLASTCGRSGRGVPIFVSARNAAAPTIHDSGIMAGHPACNAVGRSSREGLRIAAAHGPELEFLALGQDLCVAMPGGGVRSEQGTSMSTPIAAGIAAMLLAVNPCLRASDVIAAMRASARRDGIGVDDFDGNGHSNLAGYGVLRAGAALRHIL